MGNGQVAHAAARCAHVNHCAGVNVHEDAIGPGSRLCTSGKPSQWNRDRRGKDKCDDSAHEVNLARSRSLGQACLFNSHDEHIHIDGCAFSTGGDHAQDARSTAPRTGAAVDQDEVGRVGRLTICSGEQRSAIESAL